MAGQTPYLSVDSPEPPPTDQGDSMLGGLWQVARTILRPLASLWITVVLFLMAMFIVYAGTTAQVEMDIWEVVHTYFRMDLTSLAGALSSAFCFIELRILFPAAFFPYLSEVIPAGYGFYFPNGWLIGLGMFINLTAAHLIRFKIQSSGTRLWAGLLTIVLGCLASVAVIMLGSYQTADQPQLFVDYPSLRICALLLQCTVASAILAFGCWLVFRKRSGIVLLHAGVGLLMFGELLVGVFAVESQMHIVEGQTVNFTMDSREVELALIDESDQESDEVFAIPAALLRDGQLVADDQLPVKVKTINFMANSVPRPVRAGEENPATVGRGRQMMAEEVAQIGGTDNSGRTNAPAVYVQFLEKNSDRDLGTYLLSFNDWSRGLVEKLQVDGREFNLQLRYKHIYQPYSMHLIDVEQEVYMGTTKAKSYASELRLVDQDQKVDRQVRIWMNNPLRYGGATFYQSNFGVDPMTRARVYRPAGGHQYRLAHSLHGLHDCRGGHAGPVLLLAPAVLEPAVFRRAEPGGDRGPGGGHVARAEAVTHARQDATRRCTATNAVVELGSARSDRAGLRGLAAEQITDAERRTDGDRLRGLRAAAGHLRRAHQAV